MDTSMTNASEDRPAKVPMAKQAGEVRARWAWAEPKVWTERMLTALETGVKGGVWFSLMDKVYALRTLRAAFSAVKKNGGAAGVDHQTIEMYERRLEENLEELSNQLREGRYKPSAIRRKWIDKPGRKEQRPLGIPTVRDRIVQTALRYAIEPIFEKEFATHSYGFRPKRGCKDALRRVDALLATGYTWVVDADLRSYFDTIPHAPLMSLVEDKIADGRILQMIEQFLAQDIMDGLACWTPEKGSPQGAVVTPPTMLQNCRYLMRARYPERPCVRKGASGDANVNPSGRASYAILGFSEAGEKYAVGTVCRTLSP